MSVTDRQVRRLFVAMDTGVGVGLAADKAGMHRNTAARHRSRGCLPSEASAPRTYRTHADVFAADWPGIVEKLRESPGFEAKTLFADLRERRPGVYRDGHLRSMRPVIPMFGRCGRSPIPSGVHGDADVQEIDPRFARRAS